MAAPDPSSVPVPQRLVRSLRFEPGHWKQQLPAKYLQLARKGDLQQLSVLLRETPESLNAEGPHDDICCMPLLSFAVAGGHADLAEFLVGRGADVVPYSAQLVHPAARQARRDRVDVLLANGADPRAVGAGIFVTVADLGLLAYLLHKGMSPHGHAAAEMPPSVYVARGDKGERPDKVRLLLDQGADINAAGPNGKTALHYAATAGHASTITLPLARDADTTLMDREVHTALGLARAAGKIASSELLRARDAGNRSATTGRTFDSDASSSAAPLHVAPVDAPGGVFSGVTRPPLRPDGQLARAGDGFVHRAGQGGGGAVRME